MGLSDDEEPLPIARMAGARARGYVLTKQPVADMLEATGRDASASSSSSCPLRALYP